MLCLGNAPVLGSKTKDPAPHLMLGIMGGRGKHPEGWGKQRPWWCKEALRGE